jgi:penicillin-binding protein 1A
MRCGIDNVKEYAEKSGISSPLPDVPSLALGTAGISLFEIMKVYLAIANHGKTKTPGYLIKIEDRNGTLLYEYERNTNGEQVFSPENAKTMTAMLCNVVNHGTAVSLRSKYQFSEDIAGKTGTTQNQTDGWFIGYTPGLIAGVWVGGELQNIRFRSMKYGQGSESAMPVWAGFMKRVFNDDQWKFLQEEKFMISESILNDLDCEDFKERSTDKFQLFKKIKETPFFKKIFGRKKR